MYPPDDNVIVGAGDTYRTNALKAAAVWLAVIGVWLVIAWRIFGTRNKPPDA